MEEEELTSTVSTPLSDAVEETVWFEWEGKLSAVE